MQYTNSLYFLTQDFSVRLSHRHASLSPFIYKINEQKSTELGKWK